MTVGQFSFTYRPDPRRKQQKKPRRHNHALQALAIREKKVYVTAPPELPTSDVQVYFDVEGVPERRDYYLIGLLVVDGENCTTHSFWADGKAEERHNWQAFLDFLDRFSSYTLYHYGRYEQRFLDRMTKLYGQDGDTRGAVALANSCNVLSAVYSHVYFPTYSNGLKDIGHFLGASWSSENASGIQSLVWRLAWEVNRDESLKQELLAYNLEDCWALRRVRNFLTGLCDPAAKTDGLSTTVTLADDIERGNSFRFGKLDFFFPELAQINKCAYADYQRNKVYVRTCPALRKSLRRQRQQKKKPRRVNEVIECGPPERCPECGDTRVYCFRRQKFAKVISDLKFQSAGVKRWLVKLLSFRYQCGGCKTTFFAEEYRRKKSRIGHNLGSSGKRACCS